MSHLEFLLPLTKKTSENRKQHMSAGRLCFGSGVPLSPKTQKKLHKKMKWENILAKFHTNTQIIL